MTISAVSRKTANINFASSDKGRVYLYWANTALYAAILWCAKETTPNYDFLGQEIWFDRRYIATVSGTIPIRKLCPCLCAQLDPL